MNQLLMALNESMPAVASEAAVVEVAGFCGGFGKGVGVVEFCIGRLIIS